MKSAITAAAVVATLSFGVSPASSMAMSCAGDHLSKMTAMIGGMPDGQHKWEMYKHLELVNTAMAKDGMRGCAMVMRNMHRHHMRHTKQM